MAGAIIVIDQPDGAGAGSPGVARSDCWQDCQINLSCASVNSTYQWDLLDIPPGSGATLVGGGTSTPYFIPDLIGTYRIQLITNGGGPGNVQILVIRVRYDSVGVLQNRGWAPPAFGEQSGESNYNGNVRGWSEEIEYILADVRANAFTASSIEDDGVGNIALSGNIAQVNEELVVVQQYAPVSGVSSSTSPILIYEFGMSQGSSLHFRLDVTAFDTTAEAGLFFNATVYSKRTAAGVITILSPTHIDPDLDEALSGAYLSVTKVGSALRVSFVGATGHTIEWVSVVSSQVLAASIH